VIPTLDEAEGIEAAIASVLGAAAAAGSHEPARRPEWPGPRPAGLAHPAGPAGPAGPAETPAKGSAFRIPGSAERGTGAPGAVASSLDSRTPDPRHPPGGHGFRAGRGGPGSSSRVSGVVEVCVVDGGSRDPTVARAAACGVRVLELGPAGGPGGRARQLQAGVEATSGAVVVFLHADSRLPPGWREAAEEALADPAVAGGAFGFAFAPAADAGPGERLALAAVAAGARLRVAWLGLPYGDQALFVRRGVLEAEGGVPQVPLMEDLDLVAMIRRHGRLASLPLPATTSPRRYLERGVLRTAGRNLLAAAAWGLGVDRGRVAAWYRR